METLLGLEQQQALGIVLGQDRNLGLRHEQGRDRHDQRATPFTDPGLIELGSQFARDRLRVAGIDVDRQFGLEPGRFLQPGRGAAQEAALDAATFPGEPQHRLGSLAQAGTRFEEIHHGVFWAIVTGPTCWPFC